MDRLARRRSRRPADRATRARIPSALGSLASVGWIALVAGLVMMSGVLLAGEVQAALPPPNLDPAADIFQSTSVYTRDGSTLLHEIIDPELGQRVVVPLADMAPAVVVATIVTEDAAFYDNPGFDIRGIGRAFYQFLAERQVMSGGSTITQQLARRVLLNQRVAERDLTRKVKEIILAYQLTRLYSKDRILELYLNEIYYGNSSYGIEAASRGYFGKSARDLTLAEATFLAGLPQSPSDYDPRLFPGAARERQREVLGLMYAKGYISAVEAQELFAETPPILPQQFSRSAPHFAVLVQEEVEARFGADLVRRGGLMVITSLDPELQRVAEAVTGETRPRLAAVGANNLAIVALDPTDGDVLAMVGSAEFDDDAIAGQLNMTLIGRQPGTSLLPFAWIVGLGDGMTLADRIVDEPYTVTVGDGQWQPASLDGEFRGRVPIRSAINRGLVSPAARVLRDGGLERMAALLAAAGAPGLAKQPELFASVVVRGGRLTPLEVASAFATLVNAGTYHEPTILRSIQRNGRALSIPSRTSWGALDPVASYQVMNALGVDAGGGDLTPRPATIAARSEDGRDAWGIYLHPRLVVVVWVGNTDGERPLENSLPVAFDAAQEIGDRVDRPASWPRPPDGLGVVELCADVSCRVRERELIPTGAVAAVQARLLAGRGVGGATDGADPPSGRNGAEGPRPVVPSVIGLTWSEARRALERARLTPIRVDEAEIDNAGEFVSRGRAGDVVATNPPVGRAIAPGSIVRIYVVPY